MGFYLHVLRKTSRLFINGLEMLIGMTLASRLEAFLTQQSTRKNSDNEILLTVARKTVKCFRINYPGVQKTSTEKNSS